MFLYFSISPNSFSSKKRTNNIFKKPLCSTKNVSVWTKDYISEDIQYIKLMQQRFWSNIIMNKQLWCCSKTLNAFLGSHRSHRTYRQTIKKSQIIALISFQTVKQIINDSKDKWSLNTIAAHWMGLISWTGNEYTLQLWNLIRHNSIRCKQKGKYCGHLLQYGLNISVPWKF